MTDVALDKAVILARGLGTRMQETDDEAQLTAAQEAMAQTGVKAMIPIDRPFLDYVLSQLADAGYKRVCLVIGPEHTGVKDYYYSMKTDRIEISFAVQLEPLGTADAVASVEQFAGDDPVLVINSDNYYPTEALKGLREIDSMAVAVFTRDALISSSNIAPERIQKFAAVKIDTHGNMKRILEKPDAETLAALHEPVCVSMNCWRFGPEIYDACRAIEPSPRGELEITDAVQYVIDKMDNPFRVLTYDLPVWDMSSRADIPAVAAVLKGTKVVL